MASVQTRVPHSIAIVERWPDTDHGLEWGARVKFSVQSDNTRLGAVPAIGPKPPAPATMVSDVQP